MIKKFGILVIICSLMFGCAGLNKILTGSCNFLMPYKDKVQVAMTKIQADYDTYVALITGVIPVPISVFEAAKAWVAAADMALDVFGKVMDDACRTVTEAKVQEALHVANDTLPKTSLAPTKLTMYKMKYKALKAGN